MLQISTQHTFAGTGFMPVALRESTCAILRKESKLSIEGRWNYDTNEEFRMNA